MDKPGLPHVIWIKGYLSERAAREGSPKYEAPKTSLPKIPSGTKMTFTTCWFDRKEEKKSDEIEETVKYALINAGIFDDSL